MCAGYAKLSLVPHDKFWNHSHFIYFRLHPLCLPRLSCGTRPFAPNELAGRRMALSTDSEYPTQQRKKNCNSNNRLS